MRSRSRWLISRRSSCFAKANADAIVDPDCVWTSSCRGHDAVQLRERLSFSFFLQVTFDVAGVFQRHARVRRRPGTASMVTLRQIFLISGMALGVTLNCRRPRPNSSIVYVGLPLIWPHRLIGTSPLIGRRDRHVDQPQHGRIGRGVQARPRPCCRDRRPACTESGRWCRC